ncbi:MAG TPA: SDR family NAD(P)-dependent oxidoreductase [Solirubrobacteraceae bacterium]|jgi:NAD(P)-dependent dehydrogenase (short-subunit alcohol dehydrogenase family)
MPTALITGASTGIGEASALRLAAAGWDVLAGVRGVDAGKRLAEQAPSGRIEPITLDVTDFEQIRRAAERVSQLAGGEQGAPGRLDALINNAGIGFGGPLELIPPGDLRSQFDVNVLGQVAVTQALLPALRAAHGRIIFMSSVGGRVAMAFTAPYAASKHAVEAIGDALRVELASSGVQVALVEPGSVATPIWDKARESGDQLSVPPKLQKEYGNVPAAMDKVLQDTAKRGVPAEQVAQTIERALGARRMKSRYVVGRDARAMIIARRLLPDHVFDRVAKRALGV